MGLGDCTEGFFLVPNKVLEDFSASTGNNSFRINKRQSQVSSKISRYLNSNKFFLQWEFLW